MMVALNRYLKPQSHNYEAFCICMHTCIQYNYNTTMKAICNEHIPGEARLLVSILFCNFLQPYQDRQLCACVQAQKQLLQPSEHLQHIHNKQNVTSCEVLAK